MYELPHPQLGTLTEREWIVLLHVAADLSNPVISEKLFVQPRSVINTRNHIADKLDMKGHHRLAPFAHKHRSALNYWFEVFKGRKAPCIE